MSAGGSPRPALPPFRVADARACVFRAPVDVPVLTSFGRMDSRPMVLVRVEDEEGAVGWGEIWCNFPSCGAEHRARLFASVFAPLLRGRDVRDPRDVFADLTRRTRVLAIQSGEPGPVAQCIAGLDTALWDLAARRAGAPLWRLLGGGGADPEIRVYASGINPDAPERLAAARHAEGHRAFKLKVGFGEERDIANLRSLRAALGADCALMVDANQAWDAAQAVAMAKKLAPFRPAWLEEPLPADVPWSAWRRVAERGGLPLAAGENLAGERAFAEAIEAGVLSVVQPDLAKWGGFSGCWDVARRVRAAGLTYCPHYLGGGIGLLASAHLLAAVGGGMLEIDANDNPLRSLLMGPLATVRAGRCTLTEDPGLGVEPRLDKLRSFAVLGVP